MFFRFNPYSLNLIHPFSISNNTRSSTPTVQVEIEFEGLIGYGEASLPPYLQENQETVSVFFRKVDFSTFKSTSNMEEILDYIQQIDTGNAAAKAALDMAIHDFFGKKRKIPLHSMLGSNINWMPPTAYTLGIDTEDILIKKIEESHGFQILKVKLGGQNDQQMIDTIRKYTSRPIYVDANQGWKTPSEALKMILWLEKRNVVLIEQPLPKNKTQAQKWLFERSPLPLLADEDCQGIGDISGIIDRYSGINIKLMKCGGLREAQKMIALARKNSLKVMIGCMNESSCGVLAAAALAPQADYVDLDGPFLINNNPFEDPQINEGRIMLNSKPGIGLTPLFIA